MADLSYQASVEPDALPGRPNPRFPDEVSPSSYGAAIGQGIENVGTVVQSNENKMEAARQKVIAQARINQVTDFHNQAQMLSNQLTHDPNNGALTKQGKDAFGLTEQYLPQFDQGMQQLVNSVQDPDAKRAAAQGAAEMRNQFVEQLNTHELNQHKEFGIQSAKASVQIAQNAGPANYNNPNILASNLDTINASMQNLGKQQGWSDDQIQEAKNQAAGEFHTNVIDRMLTDNKPGLAQSYFKTVKDHMDANDAFHAGKMIDGYLKEKDNEAKQDIADRYQDSLKAAEMGASNPLLVSRADLLRLNNGHAERADRQYTELTTMAAAGSQAKQYNTMTPDAIAADLDKFKPTEGGQNFVAQAEGYQIRARAAQQSLKARQDDPAQFAIDSGAGWKSLNFKDPTQIMSQLASRANTREQVSTTLGVNTPLMSDKEAQTTSAMLAAQNPAQRLQTLTQLRSTMPDDDSYGALLHQIAPHQPLTAIAGAMLDKPSPANTPSWYNPQFATNSVVPQRILEGQSILEEKGGDKGLSAKFPMPPDATTKEKSGLDTAFQAAIGGSNSDLFRGRDKTQEAMWTAYKAVYAAEASRRGITNGVVNEPLAEEVANSVIGHAVPYNSTYVTVPSGMDPTRFQGVMNNAIKDAMAKNGYEANDIKALRAYGLQEQGDMLGTGQYKIIDGTGAPLRSKDRKTPIIIDLKDYTGSASAPAAPSGRIAFAGKGGGMTIGSP